MSGKVVTPEELSHSLGKSSRWAPENVTMPSLGSHNAAKVKAEFGGTTSDHRLSTSLATSREMRNCGTTMHRSEREHVDLEWFIDSYLIPAA